MVKNKKGTILMLTFILVMGLAMVVGSTTYLAVLRVRDIGGDMDYLNAYYYAQAGMAKAIWYLKNSGFGRRYRSTNLTESFGSGSYTISVKSGSTPLFVTITSKGIVRSTSRTIQANYNTYPPAFNYPLYSLQKVTMESGTPPYNITYVSGGADICVLANDNVFVNKYANANGVAVTSGHSVTGEGSYFIRPLPAPLPSFPTLESTYYNNQINIAKAKTPGGKTYSWTIVNLGGGSVYWNGNVVIGTLAFVYGPGDLVANGTITANDNAFIGSKVRLIADQDLVIQDQANVGDCDVFYSNSKVTVIPGFSDSSHISVLCPKTVSFQPSSYYGIICAGSATLEASSLLMGSAMLGNFGNVNRMAGKARINYNVDYLPDFPPPGIPGTYTLIPGTWKEY